MKQTDLRYERKFKTKLNVLELELLIKKNPYFFREIFYERTINNIYLDTLSKKFYLNNKLGIPKRKKIRIRWYGNIFGKIQKPILEYKLKDGIVGNKWLFPLNDFNLTHHNLSQQLLLKIIDNTANIPTFVKEDFKNIYPSLINSYSRKYFLSLDEKFRITLDYSLLFLDINNLYFDKKLDDNIMELKYSIDNEVIAKKISQTFPMCLNKSSKYVDGIDILKN